MVKTHYRSNFGVGTIFFFILKTVWNIITKYKLLQFSIWIYFKMKFIPVMAKLNFQLSNIYYFYQCWKWLCCLIFLWKLW